MKKFFSLILAAMLCFCSMAGEAVNAAGVPAIAPVKAEKQARQETAASEAAAEAEEAQVLTGNVLSNVRYGNGAERLRIVLDLTNAPEFEVVKEENDTRLVVNIEDISTQLKAAPALRSVGIKDVILGTYGGDVVQLIVDMSAPLPTKVYALQNPHRLVIDIQKQYEQEIKNTIDEGLDFTKYVRLDSRGMMTSYALEVDRNKFDVSLALAGANISSGRGKVKYIARSSKAAAAVNGGYFALDGSLIGNTKIDGETAGTTYYTRTSLGFMPDGTLKLAPSEYCGEVSVGDKEIYLSGVNCPRGENTTVLYNSLFGGYTRTNEYGTEYVVKDGKVTAINQGNSFIPAGTQVISAHGTAQANFLDVKVGDEIAINESFGEDLEGAENIIGAGPELLRAGNVHVTATQEKFPNDIAVGRAPRTAMGIKDDGKIILLVIDGRQSHSIGATLTETAQLLQKFGATDGFNLDGGGSSEMVIGEQIVNSPSDGGERSVASAVVVVKKQ